MRITLTGSILNLPPLDLLLAHESPVKVAALSLCQAARPPEDGACLLLVCRGARRAFQAALELLTKPNPLALTVLEQLTNLEASCEKIYEDREIIDAFGTLRRRLSHHQGWAALATAAATGPSSCHGAQAAVGVNFGLAWIKEKKLARDYMSSLRRYMGDCGDVTIADLLTLTDEDVDNNSALQWLGRFNKFRIEFQQIFDTNPNQRPSKKSFDQKAVSEWKARAAYPSFRRRAAVLDRTCLSERQIVEACRYSGLNGFASAAERRIAMWAIGFAGLNTGTVHQIPLSNQTAPVDGEWAALFDVNRGCLLRDFSGLAADAATGEGLDAQPSSFVLALPAPREVAQDIQELIIQRGGAKNFGELIPTLCQLQPEALLYPSGDELSPSWARWSRTVGTFMRQRGQDSFLSAILAGDMGQTARSKMYYARVDSHELWTAAEQIYSHFGWGQPVPEPTLQMAFGSQVVPLTSELQRIDERNVKHLCEVRPAKRSTLELDLKFHNIFTTALGLRIMVYLSMRAAKVIPIFANLDEKTDQTVDLTEKGSARRSGAIAAVMTRRFREEIRLHRQHCLAMHHRLNHYKCKDPVMDWLNSVLAREAVPLFALIHSRTRLEFLGSNAVLQASGALGCLTDDFGRKFNENALRDANCRSGDIDRVMRHEALGQETTAAVSDASERTWIARIEPILNRLHCELFPVPLHGLRRE